MNTAGPNPREESGVLGGPQVEPVGPGWRPPAETSLNHNGFQVPLGSELGFAVPPW